jgi:hypothetical protein
MKERSLNIHFRCFNEQKNDVTGREFEYIICGLVKVTRVRGMRVYFICTDDMFDIVKKLFNDSLQAYYDCDLVR